jgi:hypothetical protein
MEEIKMLDKAKELIGEHDWFYEMSADPNIREKGRNTRDELVYVLNKAYLTDQEELSEFLEEYIEQAINVARYYPPAVKALIHARYNFLKQFVVQKVPEDKVSSWRGLAGTVKTRQEEETEPLVGTTMNYSYPTEQLYKRLSNKK